MSSKSTKNIERYEAHFTGVGFDPHRHDTYAIGRTLSGVHCFNYMGEKRVSLPGNTIILHPDELHDGEAGTDEGFYYRIMYIEPSLIQSALGGKPLPFISGGVSTNRRLFSATNFLMSHLDESFEVLQEEDYLFDLVQVLSELAGQKKGRIAYDYLAAEKAREYIHFSMDQNITMDELADICGRDKWSLSRDFRALFGTSPYRYLTMRRLDLAKYYMLNGDSLSFSAVSAGFSDQSHMTHHFKKAFGLSPYKWLKSVL